MRVLTDGWTGAVLLFWLLTAGCSPAEKKVGRTSARSGDGSHKDMVWVSGGEFTMGAEDSQSYFHERPAHQVKVDGFWMDETEVTNAQFAKFVEATGYITVAERKPAWEEISKQLPPGTPKPHDSLLVAGSLVFAPPDEPVHLNDFSQWWVWMPGANWKHPEGSRTDLADRMDHPVVHIAYEDAVAFCTWSDKRLPSEAEWEFASRGGHESRPFNLAADLSPGGEYAANVFQGSFPYRNLRQDGFEGSAAVKSFPPNDYGLYDMIGNVWEWTGDFYDPEYYRILANQGIALNPKGPERSYDPNEPYIIKYVTKGGSFLCATDYCSNYRSSARQATAFDSGQSHIGFRCVRQP